MIYSISSSLRSVAYDCKPCKIIVVDYNLLTNFNSPTHLNLIRIVEIAVRMKIIAHVQN